MHSDGQTELSPRALRFLATLERRPAVPTAEVETLLTAAGCPCFTPWLVFHERYAGYVEQYYQDWFVWGLAHRDSYWWEPNQVNCEQDGAGWSIWCADGHPTYTYELDQDGVFAAHGGSRSFDLYVERVAAVRELISRAAGDHELSREELRGAAFRDLFQERIKPSFVPELSDEFRRWYVTDTHLVVDIADTGELYRAWERARHAEPGAADVTMNVKPPSSDDGR
jgi:hypothetical protein